MNDAITFSQRMQLFAPEMKTSVGKSAASEGEGVSLDSGVGFAASEGINLASSIVIDIIIGYSHLFEIAEGSEEATLAMINLSVSNANTAFRNSVIGIKLNTKEIIKLTMESQAPKIAWAKLPSADYARFGNYDANDPFQLLMHRRNRTKSDVAILFVDKSDMFCGVANLMSRKETPSSFRRFAIHVNSGSCPITVLAHEIGHNLGAHHDMDNASLLLQRTLPYAFGFKVLAGNNSFRTVMSYPCFITSDPYASCPLINYFSNPNQTQFGIAMGVVDQIDNTRAIRERAWVLRDIYTSPDVPVITRHPQGSTVLETGYISLGMEASTTSTNGILKYRWFRDDTLLDGENSATILLDTQSYWGSSATYYAEVLNEHGWGRSKGADVHFQRDHIKLTKGPEGGRVLPDSHPLTLSVVATSPSGGVLSYQWYRDGEAISGATGENLTLTSSSHSEGKGLYYVKVLAQVDGTTYTNVSAEAKVFFLENQALANGGLCRQ